MRTSIDWSRSSDRRLPTLAEIRAERDRRRGERDRERIARDGLQIEARCQTLHGFIEEHWSILEPKRPFKTGWALQSMCRHLEAFTEGRIQFLLMTVPPGMMKSLLLVFWTAWEWGPRRLSHLQNLATSYSQPNVLRDNVKLRRLIESERYQALWPLELRGDQNAKTKFENTGNGFSEARPFVSMTGGRGDRVKIDDPHSTETAESDADRETAVRVFREGISDRLNDITTSAIVIIMQRLHAKDVAAVALELDIGFVHLNLPMEFEAERIADDGKVTGGPCRTYVDGELFFEDPRTREGELLFPERVASDGKKTGGPCRTYVAGELFFEDPRTKDGELLFPERFPGPEVARLKKVKGTYAWAGQYQQRPSPRSGGMFKRAWFEIVDAAPASMRKVRRWDFAATEAQDGRDPDFTAGLLMSEKDDIYYIESVVRDQVSPAGVNKMVKNTATADGRSTHIVIPQDPGAAGKSYAASVVTLLAGWTVKAVIETGSKITRAEAIEAWNEMVADTVAGSES